MFYKDNFLSAEKQEYYNNSPEFTIALFEKVSVLKEYSLGVFVGKDKENNIVFNLPVVVLNNNTYVNIEGKRSFNNFTKSFLIQNKPEVDDIFLQKMSSQEFSNLFNVIDNEKLVQAREVVSDFHNLQTRKTVTDKYNNEYDLIIVSNEDSSIGDSLVVDTLYLIDKKTQEKIGYLKAKYNTPEILKKLKIETKKDSFTNIATVDFSRLEEEYQNKGLGYVMYFHMAQYLNSQKIEFRESTMQSKEAEQLWNGIRRHMSDYLIFKEINQKSNCAFLEIGRECAMSFMDKKPVIKNPTIKSM